MRILIAAAAYTAQVAKAADDLSHAFARSLGYAVGSVLGIVVRSNKSKPPPKIASYLLSLVLPKTYRESVLGDLTEQHPVVRAKRGKFAAYIWFYTQVLSSIWPLVKQSFLGKLKRWYRFYL